MTQIEQEILDYVKQYEQEYIDVIVEQLTFHVFPKGKFDAKIYERDYIFDDGYEQILSNFMPDDDAYLCFFSDKDKSEDFQKSLNEIENKAIEKIKKETGIDLIQYEKIEPLE